MYFNLLSFNIDDYYYCSYSILHDYFGNPTIKILKKCSYVIIINFIKMN